MDRQEAERLYDSGKEPTVEKLLELDTENVHLKETVAGLERNSRSSSKPPSSDSIRDRKERKGKKKRNGRKPGGQPGHPGKKRDLVPIDQVKEVIACYPSECMGCPHFKGCLKRQKKEDLIRWQVTEIPPITPEVTEYQVSIRFRADAGKSIEECYRRESPCRTSHLA